MFYEITLTGVLKLQVEADEPGEAFSQAMMTGLDKWQLEVNKSFIIYKKEGEKSEEQVHGIVPGGQEH